MTAKSPWHSSTLPMARTIDLPCAYQRLAGPKYAQEEEQKTPRPKFVRRLPDLDHAKSAILNGVSSPHSTRNYKFAMEQFIACYCSETRLALNPVVVLRFRLYLESLGLAAGAINQRLAAVRRLGFEAVDSAC